MFSVGHFRSQRFDPSALEKEKISSRQWEDLDILWKAFFFFFENVFHIEDKKYVRDGSSGWTESGKSH